MPSRLITLAVSLATLASCGSRSTLHGSSDEPSEPSGGSRGFGAVAASGGDAAVGGGATGGSGGATPRPTTERVSLGTPSVESPLGGYLGGISGDGERVVWSSYSDLDGESASIQVFVRYRSSLVTERVSEVNGVPGNALSDSSTISGDGRFVAFVSGATNLVGGDTNGYDDVFVVDLDTKGVERVSVTSGGVQANGYSGLPSLSHDGRYVAFWSQSLNLAPNVAHSHVYVRDRQLGTTTPACVSSQGAVANDVCAGPTISGNGRYVAFFSNATNLDGPADYGNQVYVYDLATHLTERVSRALQGAPPDSHSAYPAISEDGRYVAFESEATNLVPNDTNGWTDVFVYDRTNRTTVRASVDSLGTETNDGAYLPSISADGRFVGFYSCASNLVPNDTNGQCDVFVRDLQLGLTERVSVDAEGQQGWSPSYKSAMSSDGRVIAFDSDALLVEDDTNGTGDVFVRVRW
jgi:Tol biopolymer transport system component